MIGLIIVIVIIAMIRPKTLKLFFHEFCERKYIATAAVFIILLSGTIFFATQAPDDPSYVSGRANTGQSTINQTKALPAQTAQPTASPKYTPPATSPNNGNPRVSQPSQTSTNQAAPGASAQNNQPANTPQPPANNTPEVTANQPEKDCKKILIICLP